MIDADSRLRAARGIAKTETQASVKAFEALRRRGHPDSPPPTVSDGWGGIDDAMIEVYGKIPEYSGRGRPPVRKRVCPGWQYLQVVKQRDSRGRLIRVFHRVVFGDENTEELLGKSTAYIERAHLTMRHFNGRLVRKTLAFSKSLSMYEASAVWEDSYYNLIRPHKSLRLEVCDGVRRWLPRTPAVAAGVTDHIWSVKELLMTITLPEKNT